MEQYSPEQIEKLYLQAISTIDSDAEDGFNGIYYFAKSYDERVPEIILKALNSRDGRVQSCGAQAIFGRISGMSKDEKQLYYEPLLKIIANESEIAYGAKDDPIYSITTFGELYKPFVMEPLVACLNSENSHYRWWASVALIWIINEYHHLPYVVGYVMDCLHHDDPLVRSGIANSIAASERESLAVYAHQQLLEALDDPIEHIRLSALQALPKITRDSLTSPDDEHVIKRIIEILSENNFLYHPATSGHSHGGFPRKVRTVAISSLVRIGKKAFPLLQAALNNPNHLISGGAANVLFQQGYVAAQNVLLEYMSKVDWTDHNNFDEFFYLQAWFAEFGTTAAIPPLRAIRDKLAMMPNKNASRQMNEAINKIIERADG